MSIEAIEGIRERLLAYIDPRRPETPDQEAALEAAADAQLAYETALGGFGGDAGVASYANDGVSISFAAGRSTAPSYTRDTISPVAWSILRNARLIAYALPTAKKP